MSGLSAQLGCEGWFAASGSLGPYSPCLQQSFQGARSHSFAANGLTSLLQTSEAGIFEPLCIGTF
jgi:hypothetical protein